MKPQGVFKEKSSEAICLTKESPYHQYLSFLEQGVLGFQRDRLSGRPVFFPRVMAPGSGSVDLEWEISSGKGTVHATTVVHRRGEAPLNVALIDMDEGFRLMSRVEGVPASEVKIGMQVQLRIHREDDDSPLPIFVPESGSSNYHESNGDSE